MAVLDGLASYMRDIKSTTLLTSAEEGELALIIQSGDSTVKGSPANTALNKLVMHNLRLVIPIALRCRNRGVDVMDLIQKGNEALMRAGASFDPSVSGDVEHPARFTTYATWWIRQKMMREIQYRGDLPSAEDDELNSIPDRNGCFSSESDQVSQEMDIAAVVDELPPIMAQVVRKRYGLSGEAPMTLQAIGESMTPRVTKERVRQLECSAHKLLRRRLSVLEV